MVLVVVVVFGLDGFWAIQMEATQFCWLKKWNFQNQFWFKKLAFFYFDNSRFEKLQLLFDKFYWMNEICCWPNRSALFEWRIQLWQLCTNVNIVMMLIRIWARSIMFFLIKFNASLLVICLGKYKVQCLCVCVCSLSKLDFSSCDCWCLPRNWLKHFKRNVKCKDYN